MTLSTQKPTQPGHYWYQSKGLVPYVEHVFLVCKDNAPSGWEHLIGKLCTEAGGCQDCWFLYPIDLMKGLWSERLEEPEYDLSDEDDDVPF